MILEGMRGRAMMGRRGNDGRLCLWTRIIYWVHRRSLWVLPRFLKDGFGAITSLREGAICPNRTQAFLWSVWNLVANIMLLQNRALGSASPSFNTDYWRIIRIAGWSNWETARWCTCSRVYLCHQHLVCWFWLRLDCHLRCYRCRLQRSRRNEAGRCANFKGLMACVDYNVNDDEDRPFESYQTRVTMGGMDMPWLIGQGQSVWTAATFRSKSPLNVLC